MEGRLDSLLRCNEEALNKLALSSDFFTGQRRLEIFRLALAPCTVCEELRATCFTSLFDFHKGDALETVCHTISRFQTIMTKEEHTRMFKRLRESLPEMEGLDELDGYSVFAEIIVVVSLSVGIRKFYQCLGKLLPSLPKGSDSVPPRTPVSHWIAEVKNDPALGFSPFVIRYVAEEDVFPLSPGSPMSKVRLTKASQIFDHWEKLMYMESKDVPNFSKGNLDAKLSRFELETVASGATSQLQCSF